MAASIAQAATRPPAPPRPVTPSTRSIFETGAADTDPTPAVATPPPLPAPAVATPPPLPVPGSSVRPARAEAAETMTSLPSPTDPDLDEAEPAVDGVEPPSDRPTDPTPVGDDGAWTPPIVPITRPTPLPALAPVEPAATPATVPPRVSVPPLPEAPPASGPGRFADGRFLPGAIEARLEAPTEAPWTAASPAETPAAQTPPTQTPPTQTPPTETWTAPPPASPYAAPAPWTPTAAYPPASGHGFSAPEHPTDAAPGWSGLAITAFVLSLLALGPISIVLAILALRRIRRSGQRGRGLAVAATILSALGVLFWAGVVAVSVFAVNRIQVARDGQGVVNRAGLISASQLQVGDCLTNWDVGVVSLVGVTPCREPHHAQVFTEQVLPPGAYPGEQAVIASADKLCTDQAAGRNWDGLPGDARVSYLYPRSDGWASGDRHVTCLVVTSASVTGSAAGVGGGAPAATPSS